MIAKKVPVYIYEQSTQVSFRDFIILMSNALWEAYKDLPLATEQQIGQWSGINVSNLAQLINNFINEPLLSRSLSFNTALDNGYALPSWSQSGFNCLGVSINPAVKINNANNLRYKTVDGNTYTPVVSNNTYDTQNGRVLILYSNIPGECDFYIQNSTRFFEGHIHVLPEDAFNSEGALARTDALSFRIYGYLSNDFETVTQATLTVRRVEDGMGLWSNPFNIKAAQGSDSDINTPWSDDNNDGGDGDQYPPQVDPTDIPPLPDTGVGNCGLFTMYLPTLSQIQALGAFLWTGLFDPDNFKKLFNDPMQCIIGLGILPCAPASAGSKNIKFGSVDSGVNSSYITSQYVSFNCGSVKIRKDVGSFLDYTDTKISIFLPFIGFRELATIDVMGASISVVYNVDCLTGSCVAFIKHESRGIMYAFNGSCIANVPLSGTNFSGAIQNAVSTVASGVGVLAGIASGAAPITAMSAVSMLNSAANTALNAKPTVQRSGNIGGAAGLLSGKQPFVIIERPNYSVPEYVANYEGRICNKTAYLSSLSGFTMVEKIHLDNIDATEEELKEIDMLLKEGVIL